MAEQIVLTSAEVEQMNRAAIARSTAFVRIAGTALVVIGTIGAAAWLWSAVRTQQNASPSLGLGRSSSSGDVSFVDRLDLLAPFMGELVVAALVVGFGLLLRATADFITDRIGGSITGFSPGDTLPDDDDQSAPQPSDI